MKIQFVLTSRPEVHMQMIILAFFLLSAVTHRFAVVGCQGSSFSWRRTAQANMLDAAMFEFSVFFKSIQPTRQKNDEEEHC